MSKIWVIVDRFSKMSHFIALPTVKKTEDMAKIFLTQVWKYHGLPDDIVSDRDSKFIFHFWQSLVDLFSINLNLSTALHPKTEGQTQRVNQMLEAFIRNYCSYHEDNFSDHLPLAEYAYYSTISEAMKFSPFCANYGFEPRINWPNAKPATEWDKLA
jgi:hypothetical protein